MYQNFTNKWFVAQIKPNSYDLASRNLIRQKFELFAPKMKVTTKKKGQFVHKKVLLFPQYLFIGINSQSSNWTKINSTYGVSKVLTVNNKPSEVPHALIVSLKNRYENNNNQIIEEDFKKGDKIKFNSGPFTELVVKIEKIDKKNRIYVLLEAMGGHRKLEIKPKEELNFIKTYN